MMKSGTHRAARKSSHFFFEVYLSRELTIQTSFFFINSLFFFFLFTSSDKTEEWRTRRPETTSTWRTCCLTPSIGSARCAFLFSFSSSSSSGIVFIYRRRLPALIETRWNRASADTDIYLIKPFLFIYIHTYLVNRNRNDCKQNSRARRRSNTTPR